MNAMPRTVAVVQARMGSRRFPGKMLRELAGKPLLFHVLERARRIRSADAVVLATSTLARDDPLVALAGSMRVAAVRGPEEDVLARFLLAVEATGAEVVIRICGDAPLFDPGFLDDAAALLRSSGADLVRVRDDAPSALQGAEVVSARALRWSAAIAPDDPLAREHVTGYALAHPGGLRVATIDPDPGLLGEFHLSIDRPGDLEIMRRIYDRLYVAGEVVSLRKAVDLLRASPARVRA